MDAEREVMRVIDEVLSLGGRSASFSRNTLLLTAIPSLDSMAVVALVTSLEDRFEPVVNDDGIDSDTFASVGSLVDSADAQLAA